MNGSLFLFRATAALTTPHAFGALAFWREVCGNGVFYVHLFYFFLIYFYFYLIDNQLVMIL